MSGSGNLEDIYTGLLDQGKRNYIDKTGIIIKGDADLNSKFQSLSYIQSIRSNLNCILLNRATTVIKLIKISGFYQVEAYKLHLDRSNLKFWGGVHPL